MHKPFSPHPNWRNSFAFTSSYPNADIGYKLDPIIAQPKAPADQQFKLDPIIHRYSNVHTDTKADI